jgi:hypothetical protein
MSKTMRLLPVLASCSFLAFLILIYYVTTQMEDRYVSETLASSLNQASWVWLFPNWFFQLLNGLLIVAAMGLSYSTIRYFDSSKARRKSGQERLPWQ